MWGICKIIIIVAPSTIDITIFIASELEWDILTLSGSTTTIDDYPTMKITNQELADIPEDE